MIVKRAAQIESPDACIATSGSVAQGPLDWGTEARLEAEWPVPIGLAACERNPDMDDTRLFTVLLIIGAVLGVRWAMGYARGVRLKQWWQRAEEAMAAGDLERAQKALRKCVSVMPTWVPGRMLLGAVLAKNGNLTGAEEQLLLGAQLTPRRFEGHFQLGMFYATFFDNRMDEAVESLSTAVDLNPPLREKLAAEPSLRALRDHEPFRRLLEEPTEAGD